MSTTIYDDIWTDVGVDWEAEHTADLLTAARTAAAGLWPFLAAAGGHNDFEHRRALASESIDAAARKATEAEPEHFLAVRNALDESLILDFQQHFAARQDAEQARNAPRAAQRARQRRQAAKYTWHPDMDTAGNLNPTGQGMLLAAEQSEGGGYAVVSNSISYGDAVARYGDVERMSTTVPVTVNASRRHAAKATCVYDGTPGCENHSDDILEVYSGKPEPTYICGYHEQRFSVPGSAKSPLNSDGTRRYHEDGSPLYASRHHAAFIKSAAAHRVQASDQNWETHQADLILWNTFEIYNPLGGVTTVDQLKALMAPYMKDITGDLSSIDWDSLLQGVLEDEYMGLGGEGRTASIHTARSLAEIAQDIRRDWVKPYFGAVPYIDAMSTLDGINDMYGAENGASIVAYFLGNTNGWRGETAKALKAELKGMLKGARYSSRQLVAPGLGLLAAADPEMRSLMDGMGRQIEVMREQGISGSGQPETRECRHCGAEAKFDKIYASFPSAYANYDCPSCHKETHYKPEPKTGSLKQAGGSTDPSSSGYLDDFVRAYATAALWTDYDDNEDPLDANYDEDDIDQGSLSQHRTICQQFIQQNAADLKASGMDASRAGHNLWLNTHGHGSGFWDEDGVPDDIRQRLSAACDRKPFDQVGNSAYVGDNGRVYLSAKAPNLDSRFAALVTSVSGTEIEKAIRDHAESTDGTLKAGDRIGNATITEVGTHTIQYRTDDGWSGSVQIPWFDGQQNPLPSFERAQAAKVAISLTNVGIDPQTQNGVGTDPSGKRVQFRLSDEDREDLKSVLLSDLAVNFSGVDVTEDEIIAEGAKVAITGSPCTFCGEPVNEGDAGYDPNWGSIQTHDKCAPLAAKADEARGLAEWQSWWDRMEPAVRKNFADAGYTRDIPNGSKQSTKNPFIREATPKVAFVQWIEEEQSLHDGTKRPNWVASDGRYRLIVSPFQRESGVTESYSWSAVYEPDYVTRSKIGVPNQVAAQDYGYDTAEAAKAAAETFLAEGHYSSRISQYGQRLRRRLAAEDAIRWASPQAWRRLRSTMTSGELRDIARDIADTMPNGSPDEIYRALSDVDWDARKQGSLRQRLAGAPPFAKKDDDKAPPPAAGGAPADPAADPNADPNVDPAAQEFVDDAAGTPASDIAVGDVVLESGQGETTVRTYEVTKVTPEDGGTVLVHVKSDTDEFDARVPVDQTFQVHPKGGKSDEAPAAADAKPAEGGDDKAKNDNPFMRSSMRVEAVGIPTLVHFTVPGGGDPWEYLQATFGTVSVQSLESAGQGAWRGVLTLPEGLATGAQEALTTNQSNWSPAPMQLELAAARAVEANDYTSTNPYRPAGNPYATTTAPPQVTPTGNDATPDGSTQPANDLSQPMVSAPAAPGSGGQGHAGPGGTVRQQSSLSAPDEVAPNGAYDIHVVQSAPVIVQVPRS